MVHDTKVMTEADFVRPDYAGRWIMDKKSLSDGRNIGESAVACQGKTWHGMLSTGRLRRTRASELV